LVQKKRRTFWKGKKKEEEKSLLKYFTRDLIKRPSFIIIIESDMSLPPPMVKYDAFGSDVPLAEPSWCALFSSSSFTLRLSFFFFSPGSLFFFCRRRPSSANFRYNFRFDAR